MTYLRIHFLISALEYNMSDICEIKEIDGKGFGCFATKDIKRGTVVLIEFPQLALESEINNNAGEIDFNPTSMKMVASAFNGKYPIIF